MATQLPEATAEQLKERDRRSKVAYAIAGLVAWLQVRYSVSMTDDDFLDYIMYNERPPSGVEGMPPQVCETLGLRIDVADDS